MMSDGLQFKSCHICLKVVQCNQKGICVTIVYVGSIKNVQDLQTKNSRISEVTTNLGSAAHV